MNTKQIVIRNLKFVIEGECDNNATFFKTQTNWNYGKAASQFFSSALCYYSKAELRNVSAYFQYCLSINTQISYI
jgi:hypothetical protein